MSEHWRTLAQNYARFDTPLRPSVETLAALKALLPTTDPLVVVLGGTPLFGGLARRVWFVDVAQDALQLAQPTAAQRTIQKNWLTAADEFSQADLVVGDAAINALDSPAAAAQLLRVLAENLKPGATLAMRVFVKHALPADDFRRRLAAAFEAKRYSEIRFLIYGVVAGADGVAAVADIDRFIADLGMHLPLERSVCERYQSEHSEWRGMSPAAAGAVGTKAFIPSRAQIEELFGAAGLRPSTIGAGPFRLAEFTPLYVART
jgi:hypothetical protein